MEGTDEIRGLGGDDVICGDDGLDVILPGDGNDTVDGGAADDTISYTDHSAGVSASLAAGAGGSAGEFDTIVGFERVQGTDAADDLTGDAAANMLDGLGGDDTLVGGSGGDIISGGDARDTIDGGDGADVIDGGAGDDDLDGGAGAGNDSVHYGGRSSGVTASLSSGIGGSAGESDSIVGFEHLVGGDGPDVLTGDAGSNEIVGAGGDDTMIGGAGADRMHGGDGDDTIHGDDGDDHITGEAGDDVLDGGVGNDVVDYLDHATDVTASLSSGVGGSAGESDAVAGFERLTGGLGGDTLTGDAGPNIIDGVDGDDTVMGGLGDDVLFGGNGVDTASYEDHAAAVTVSLAARRGASAGELDSLSDLEDLKGGSGPDVLTGTAGPNTVLGGLGDDTLTGLTGDDVLDGGIGFDTVSYADAPAVSASLATLVGGRAGETDTLLGAEALTGGPGADVLTGDAGANRLDGGPGDDALDGGPGADALEGSAGADRLTGGDGNDALDGGADADAFTGGDGDDVLEARDGVADSAFDCGPGSDTLHADSPADDATARAGCELPASPPPPPPPPSALTALTATPLPPVLPLRRPACAPGTPSRGWCGDGGPARQARLAAPSDVAVAADGSIFIADTLNNVIRLLRRGKIYTIAGTGVRGLRNGSAGQAQFDTPAGVAIWPGRGVLVADTGNDAIRLVEPTGRVSTLVSSQGLVRRRLSRPRDVLGLPDGSLRIADTGGHQVLEVSPTGKVAVLAGSGREGYSGDGLAAQSARLSNPSQLTFARDGSLLIADTGNGAVRRVTRPGTPSSTISTVIGDLDGPRGVLDLPGGNVLVGDDSRLILVVAGKDPVTVGGDGRRGSGDDGPALKRRFSAIGQLADSGDGFVVVTERGNNSVGILPYPTSQQPNVAYKVVSGSVPPEAASALARLRLPPPKALVGKRGKTYGAKAPEDDGDCLDESRFRFELLPAGDPRKLVKHSGGRLAFDAAARVTVVLELYRGKRPSRRNKRPVKTLRVGVRKGESRTRRLGKVGKGYYDAVLWGMTRDQELRCDVRPMRVK